MALSLLFTPASNRGRLFWQLQALGWAGTLLISMGVTTLYWPPHYVVLLSVFCALFGLGATSFLLRPLFRKARREGWRLTWPRLLGQGGLCLLLGGADMVASMQVAQALGGEVSPGGVSTPLIWVSLLLRCLRYGLWSALYFGIHYRLDTQYDQLRAANAEAALRAGELQLLRSQVNPHFLFNSLNSILAVSSRPESVQHLTLALADYLRFSLRQHGDTERLGMELEALESYLKVEKIRFGNNLEYAIHATAGARTATAPVALLQPLLENAIKYGQRSAIRPVRLQIHCDTCDDRLSVAIRNTGPWCEPEAGTPASTGIGLANLRRRLALLYGERAFLKITPGAEEVCVTVCLPMHPLPV